MEILIILLLVPVLGGTLLIAEWQSREALGRRERMWCRIGLLLAGLMLAPIAAGLMAIAVVQFLTDPIYSLLFVVRLLLVVVVGFAAVSAVLVSRLGEARSLSVRETARRNRLADQMRLSSWLLVCFPLLWLFALGMVFVAPVLYFVAIWSTASRARQGRLLWLLTIATENGLPLPDEVESFAMEFRGGRRDRLLGLASRLRDGGRLSDALEVDGWLLPVPEIHTIRAGEETGTLPAALRSAAVRQLATLRQTYVDGSVAAMASYYWIVISILFTVFGGMMYWIVPKFKVIFEDFGVALPRSTLWIIELADHFVDYFWLIIPLVTIPMSVMFVLTYVYLVGWGNLNWPLLMRWFPRRDAPGVLRSLAVAAASGRPLPGVVRGLGERHPRRDLGERLGRIGETLEAGDETWTSLRDEGFLSRPEAEAVAASARARHLPFALQAIADGMDRARRRRLLWCIELGKPVLILGMAAFVGFYCVAFFLPLVKLIREI